MKPVAALRELSDFMRRGLKADPGAKVCVGTIREKEDGGRAVAFALLNSVDPGDLVEFADSLLRHAGEKITNGRHPDCDNCRQNIARIEAARAALGIDQPEGTPS